MGQNAEPRNMFTYTSSIDFFDRSTEEIQKKEYILINSIGIAMNNYLNLTLCIKQVIDLNVTVKG